MRWKLIDNIGPSMPALILTKEATFVTVMKKLHKLATQVGPITRFIRNLLIMKWTRFHIRTIWIVTILEKTKFFS